MLFQYLGWPFFKKTTKSIGDYMPKHKQDPKAVRQEAHVTYLFELDAWGEVTGMYYSIVFSCLFGMCPADFWHTLQVRSLNNVLTSLASHDAGSGFIEQAVPHMAFFMGPVSPLIDQEVYRITSYWPNGATKTNMGGLECIL
jgi:hypothetical protein